MSLTIINETDITEINTHISSESINLLDPICFEGKVHLINTKKDPYDDAIKILKSAEILGFDTESKPAFVKGQKFPISLIQIAKNDEVFIFQIKRKYIPHELIDILSSEKILKIGVGINDDIKKIKQIYPSFQQAGFIDISSIAKSKGLIQTSARVLTARYLHKRLVKSSQTTNWAKTNLSERQIKYASTDAWVMLKIYKLILNDKTDYHTIQNKDEHTPTKI